MKKLLLLTFQLACSIMIFGQTKKLPLIEIETKNTAVLQRYQLENSYISTGWLSRYLKIRDGESYKVFSRGASLQQAAAIQWFVSCGLLIAGAFASGKTQGYLLGAGGLTLITGYITVINSNKIKRKGILIFNQHNQ